MTTTENAAEKTLREANEFLEKHGLTAMVESLFEEPETKHRIKSSYDYILGQLDYLNKTAPELFSKCSEEFIKTFREVENEEKYHSDVKDNFKRSLHRSNETFAEILKLIEAETEFPVKFPEMLKELFNDPGKNVLLLDLKSILDNIRVEIIAGYFTECIAGNNSEISSIDPAVKRDGDIDDGYEDQP